jgi:cathepsin B
LPKKSWAVSTAAVLSDRLCIKSNQQKQVLISAEDLLTCCGDFCCPRENACEGGYPDRAFEFFRKHGIVSGGGYHSHYGCKPYSFSDCLSKNGKNITY